LPAAVSLVAVAAVSLAISLLAAEVIRRSPVRRAAGDVTARVADCAEAVG
jgi:hypothetical protein